MIERYELERICDSIENRLYQLSLPVMAIGGKVYPQAGFVELQLKPNAVKGKSPKVDSILNAQPDIANAVGNNNVRVYQDSKAQITVEIQICSPKAPDINDLAKQVKSKYELILGNDRIGSPLVFDLKKSNNAHLLISGTTGSGKTALAHSIILNATMTHTPDELKIVVLDHNNVDADWFYPKIKPFLATEPPNDILGVEALLNQIAAKMFTANAPYKTVILIDELAGLCSESTVALKAIETIAQQGRKYGVHMIACTQKPTTSVIGNLMKSNMRRAVGKVASPEDSKVASGIAGVGAENLQGNGQFIFVDNELIRFQSALPEGYGERRPPEATVADGSMFDFTLETSATNQKGINLQSIMQAMKELENDGKKVLRKSVLEKLGYNQAGGASRKINELWDEALARYSNSKSDIDAISENVGD